MITFFELLGPEFFLTLGSILKWAGIAALPLFLVPPAIFIAPKLFAGFGERLYRTIDWISGGLMKLAFAAAMIMVFAQLAVIIGRFVFSWSRTSMSETVIFGFAAMFLLGAAATLRDDGHVRVDILRGKMGPRAKAWIEIIGIYLLLVPMCICIIWASTQGSFVRAWQNFLGSSEDDGLKIWFLFKTLVPAFAAFVAAQGLSEAIKTALTLKGTHPKEASTQPQAESV